MTKNPARRLYRQWEAVLGATLSADEIQTGVGIAYGRKPGWGISFNPAEHDLPDRISLGYFNPWIAYNRLGVYSKFEVTREGDFRFTYMPHGYIQRNVLAANTFLTWQYFMGGYHWVVDEESREGQYMSKSQAWWGKYEERPAYFPDRLMSYHWLRLRRREDGYDMEFAARSLAKYDWLAPQQTWHHQVREKRWARAHLDWKRDMGLAPPKKRHPLSVKERLERAEQRTQRAAVTISAHMEVSAPANNRKSREAKKEAACPAPAGRP